MGERRRFAREAFRNDARNWVDTLRIARVSAEELKQRVAIDGWELLDAVMSEGRGAIIVSMHLGNFDLVGQLIAARGYALTVPVERMEPPKLFHLLCAQRASKGIKLVPVEQASRALVSALAAHEIVGLTVDRPVGGKTIEVDLFGHPARFSRGLASLVRYADVPVFVGVGLRGTGGRYRGKLVGPLPMVRERVPNRDMLNTRQVAARMEEFIRAYPGQWLAFWPLWPSVRPSAPAATISQQSEAAV